jgi:plastocyanin
MQNVWLRRTAGYGCALLLLLSGCGGHKQTVNVTAAAPGQKVNVEMKASNFAFDPAVIIAQKGETLVLHVTDVSGETHNITVKDPSGKVLQSADIPGRQAITVEVPLEVAGVYPFTCDKPFHSTLGMKGRIEVK